MRITKIENGKKNEYKRFFDLSIAYIDGKSELINCTDFTVKSGMIRLIDEQGELSFVTASNIRKIKVKRRDEFIKTIEKTR